MKKVAANGCFDGLHPGHMFYLGFCCAQGDKLYIGINCDEYMRRKKRSNFIPAEERKKSLLDLGFIEEVIIYDEDSACEFIKTVSPDIYCTGEEYREKTMEVKLCKDMGIKVVYIRRIGKWSSTLLRNNL